MHGHLAATMLVFYEMTCKHTNASAHVRLAVDVVVSILACVHAACMHAACLLFGAHERPKSGGCGGGGRQPCARERQRVRERKRERASQKC